MEQIHLVVYLESFKCVEVRKDKKGYIIMRNETNNKTSGIPLPKNGGNLKQTTICSVCKQLDVEIPPSSPKEIKDMLNFIEFDIKSRKESGQ